MQELFACVAMHVPVMYLSSIHQKLRVIECIPSEALHAPGKPGSFKLSGHEPSIHTVVIVDTAFFFCLKDSCS